MNFRTLSLASVAVAGLLLATAPAMADDNYHKESTPAERIQTNSLNTDAAARAQANTNADMAARDDYDAARAAYERSLNNYDYRRAAYENDRARYEGERLYYDRDRLQRWSSFHYRDRYRDVVSFQSDELIGKVISTRNGHRIGRIRDVGFNNQGQVNRIAIQVGRHRVAWVYADDVRYDPRRRAFLIDLSNDQVNILARMRGPGA